MRDGFEIVHAINVCSSRYGQHSLLTYYNESNPMGAVGGVLCGENIGSGRSEICLGANCQLNAMWSSPEGNLWVVDDHGDVFTTAIVSFERDPYQHLNYHSGSFDIEWSVTEVSPRQLNGIWGSSDQDVWVTSFVGPAFHWNGKKWTQFELAEAPNDIHGSASDDVYVVGYHGNIHHWNGLQWSKIVLPESIPQQDAFTGVRAVNRDLVYIVGRSGCVLVGNAREGFRDIGSPAYAWYGIGCFKNRVFLAGGPKGIFELKDGEFVCLKDKGHPVGVFELDDSICFIPAEQQPNPWFVNYAPGSEREWTKIST